MNVVTSSGGRESSQIKSWFISCRPRTLIAGAAPVFLGSALAFKDGTFNFLPAFLCLLFSLLMQIACNFANDYFDHKSGVDTENRKGPKRGLANGSLTPQAVKVGIIVTLTLGFGVACGLVYFGGLSIIFIALLAIISALAYTGGPFPLGYNGLGSLFVLIFFGFIAVMYTYYLQSGYFSLESFWVALAFGLMAVNLREVNDARDIETDVAAGKRTMAVRFGKSFIENVYLINYTIALAVPIFLVFKSQYYFCLLPLLTIPYGFYLIINLIKAKLPEQIQKVFNGTAKLLIIYALTFTLGIALS